MITNIDIAILESAGQFGEAFLSTRLVLNCKIQNFKKYHNKIVENIT